MFSLILYSCLVAILGYYFFSRKRINFPPGPTQLPIVGNILQLGNFPHLVYTKLSKEYGPIVGVRLGLDRAVCLHGAKLIKEAYNEPAFSARQDIESLRFVFGEPDGILNASGDIWTEQRRFTLRNLRDFGFGKSSIEDMVMDEVNEFSNWLRRQSGKPVPLQRRFALAVVNALWRILAGERIDDDNKRVHDILDGLENTAKTVFRFKSIKTLLLFAFPSVAKLFSNWSGWNRLAAIKTTRDTLFLDIISQHLTDLPEDSPRDFVDLYLQEVKKTSNRNSSFHGAQGEKSLKSVMADFFLAGTDTTSVTLSWAMLYLLHYPDVQKKLHSELDREIGRSRNASLSDRKSLPYTEAVILETLRLSSIVPLTIGHCVTEDTKFHGYDFPKGTLILANTYAAHHDPEVWGDPEVFRPERFLSPDGTTLERHEGLLIPFSVGRRVCAGETFARDTLFLFLANVMHNFEVIIPHGIEKPTLEIKRQVTIAPVSSIVVMKERFTN